MNSENKFIELKNECAKYGNSCDGCPLKKYYPLLSMGVRFGGIQKLNEAKR